jgi:HEPN domain-containing protein
MTDYKHITRTRGNHPLSIMAAMKDWREEIRAEIERAEKARARGNEGQARVCARRAAGIAAREYLARRGEIVRTPSAYDLLNLLKDDPRLPLDLKQIAEHLTLRVNEEFKLPVDIDLIAESKKFCEEILKIDPNGL